MKSLVYLFTQDSILRAFEGPEEPNVKHSVFHPTWMEKMSTARESALPVVNWMDHYSEQNFTHIMLSNDGSIPSVKPGETVALPGWGLEKVKQYWSGSSLTKNSRMPEWVACTNELHEKVSETREAYRLVRSEPQKKEPIKLTFYSGKLWHSDKPAPIFMDEEWLSTAYEVVNAEGTIPGYDRVQKQWLKDGDQLTLPEGYGIDNTEFCGYSGCTGDPNCFYALCLITRTKIATITIPEKPENSAHGERTRCFGIGCPTEIMCIELGKCQSTVPVVEPSESQEEDVRITIASNVIGFLAKYIHGINAGKDKSLLDIDFDNAFDQYNRLVTVHSKDEKFTITRK